jgi:hypothetical protein
MKKKKLESKLSKTKKKLADTRTELDAVLSIIKKSGMPKTDEKPAVGKRPARKPAAAAKPKAAPKARAVSTGAKTRKA